MSIFCSINLCTHHNEEVIYSILVVTLSYACIPCNQQIPLMLQSCVFTHLLSSGEFICQFCKYIGQSFVPAHCTQHKDKMCTEWFSKMFHPTTSLNCNLPSNTSYIAGLCPPSPTVVWWAQLPSDCTIRKLCWIYRIEASWNHILSGKWSITITGHWCMCISTQHYYWKHLKKLGYWPHAANMIRGTSNPRSIYNAKDKHTQWNHWSWSWCTLVLWILHIGCNLVFPGACNCCYSWKTQVYTNLN